MVQGKRVIIIANGDLENLNFYRELVGKDDFVVCVNGGSAHALVLGMKPALVVGDLDSLDPGDRHKLEAMGPRFIKYPSAKDKSDLEIALDHAVAMQPAEIIIIGALGGKRTDHAFINLLLLNIPHKEGIRARIVDHTQDICLVDGEMEIGGSPGDYLSLFSLTAETKDIFTEGLRYPLQGESLFFASTLGLSNELTASKAKVKIGSGLLLVIKTKSVTPVRSNNREL
ncbi:MAG: thiamine diphosphokinase [Bacillota bacterium]